MSKDGITNISYVHLCDIYSKEVVESESGQKQPEWTLEVEGQICWNVPQKATVRVNPTSEQADKIILFLPITANIEYDSRIENLRTRFGVCIPTLEEKSFEVKEIRPFSNFIGKPIHLQVKAESIIE